MKRCVFLYLCFFIPSISGKFNNEPTEYKEVDYDDEVTLQCKPETGRAEWIQNSNNPITMKGKVLNNHKSYVSFTNQNQDNNYDIKIRNFRKNYEGLYECIDANGYQMSSYDLKITEAPTINEFTRDFTATENDTVFLWCNATGVPPPKITWYIVGEQGETVSIGIDGRKLQIRQISRDCAATYRCSVINRVAKEPVEKDIRVSVEYKPDIKGIEIIEGRGCPDDEDIELVDEAEVEGRIGETVSLICHWQAVPLTYVQWQKSENGQHYYSIGSLMKDGKVASFTMGNGDLETCGTGTFKLTVELNTDNQFSTYKCIVKNKYGEDDFSVKIVETS